MPYLSPSLFFGLTSRRLVENDANKKTIIIHLNIFSLYPTNFANNPPPPKKIAREIKPIPLSSKNKDLLQESKGQPIKFLNSEKSTFFLVEIFPKESAILANISLPTSFIRDFTRRRAAGVRERLGGSNGKKHLVQIAQITLQERNWVDEKAKALTP